MSKMNSFSALPTQTAAALLQMFYHLSDTSQKPRSYLSSFPPKTVISVSSIYILFCIPFSAVHISEWSLIWVFHSSSSSIIITNIYNYKPDHMALSFFTQQSPDTEPGIQAPSHSGADTCLFPPTPPAPASCTCHCSWNRTCPLKRPCVCTPRSGVSFFRFCPPVHLRSHFLSEVSPVSS